MRTLLITCTFMMVIATCSEAWPEKPVRSQQEVMAKPTIDRIKQLEQFNADLHTHIQVLASDEFEGRAPATVGETKTLNYLTAQFTALGLKAGAGDSFLQEVPIVELVIEPDITLDLKGDNYSASFSYGSEMMVATQQQVASTGIKNSELVFAGYGIVAPEHNWNDYAGLDVTGKTVVVLVNDPGYNSQNPALFKGKAMTYYGRWSYKFEEAARRGAAGVLIVHEVGAAGYPWDVVKSSWSGTRRGLRSENNNSDRCAIEGWLALESAKALFNAAGLDFGQARVAATKPGFKPQPLNITASVQLSNTLKYAVSNNLLAMIPGSEKNNEAILYMAHWDHLGIKPGEGEDHIYNGAVDNASGTAALLALAHGFMNAPEPPERSILFLALTGEESGLLGSAYYARHPVIPLNKTVAGINMDVLNFTGPTNDVSVVGYGSSELENYLAEAAAHQNRKLTQEPTPESGQFYRSDHFNLAKAGVPVLFARGGFDGREKSPEWVIEHLTDYLINDYHKPSDEYDPSWDLRGAAEDLQLFFDIGYRLSLDKNFPNWFEGNEFRATRDQSLAELNQDS